MTEPGIPGERENQEVLEAALRYAAAGAYVFPVRIRVRGNGKKDVNPIATWKTASTNDPEVIRGWFAPDEGTWRGAAVAIDCGKSGIVGVDQDVSDGKNGPALWAELREMWAPTVLTPSGGRHEYYRADPTHPITVDNSGAVADGVDIRGLGGFLFAPPSVDPRGGRWAWKEGEPDWARLPSLPEVVVKRIAAKDADKRPKALTSVDENRGAVSYVDALERDPLFSRPTRGTYGPDGGYKTVHDAGQLLDRRLKEFIALTEPGSSRSHILAQDLGVLAGHGVPTFWSYDFALDALLDACRVNGFIGEHGATYAMQQIGRGLDYGMTEPWHVRTADAGDAVPEKTGRLRRALLTRSQVHHLADPVPLIEDVLYRESVVVLSGKFGTYKSFIAVSWAASLASGEDWFGHRVPEPVPVIYAAAEGAYGIRKRLDAWEEKHRCKLPDSLYLISVSVRLNRPEDVRELDEIVAETGAKVLVFDTLHMSTPGVDENDSGQMGAVMDTLRTLQRRHGLTSILPHHTGHAGERARGSSSVEDDADTSFVVRIEGEDRGPESRRTLVHRKTKDSALLPPVELTLELIDGTGSGVVTTANEYQRAAGQEHAPPPVWPNTDMSVRAMVCAILAEHGYERGLTKAEVRSMIIERWYGNVSDRLSVNDWHPSWNKAVKRPEIMNVGGERFSADPVVIEDFKLNPENYTESDE